MRYLAIIILVTTFIFISIAHGQPEMEWSQTIGGDQPEICYSVIQTTEGGYALTGGLERDIGFGQFDLDGLLILTNEDGEEIWRQTYGGEGLDEFNTGIQTTDGGYALAGLSESFGRGSYDFWLLKTDENGDSLWSQTYGGDVGDVCYSLIQTVDSGFVLAGSGLYNMVKTDDEGDVSWTYTFNGGFDFYCSSVIQTTDSSFVLAGSIETGDYHEGDCMLVKVDENGDEQWTRTYGEEGIQTCSSVIQTAGGGFALAGNTGSFGFENNSYWIVKTDEEGRELWSRVYEGENEEYIRTLLQVPDNGFVMAGDAYSIDDSGSEFYLVRIDEGGGVLWSQTYGNADENWCNSVLQTDDYSFILAGSTYDGDDDCLLIKTEPDPVSTPRIDPPTPPSKFELMAAYPNPFNSTATIRYSLPFSADISLDVFNPIGQRVQTLFDGQKQAGTHNISITATDMVSGLYFIRLEAPESIQTRKLLLVR
jgi:hypothetical protein